MAHPGPAPRAAVIGGDPGPDCEAEAICRTQKVNPSPVGASVPSCPALTAICHHLSRDVMCMTPPPASRVWSPKLHRFLQGGETRGKERSNSGAGTARLKCRASEPLSAPYGPILSALLGPGLTLPQAGLHEGAVNRSLQPQAAPL